MKMKQSLFSVVLPVLLLVVAIGLGSCKKSHEVKAIITVIHDTIEPVGTDTAGFAVFDTVTSPVLGATVRMWSDQIGSLIDTNFTTNSSGQAEFEFDHVAILRMSVKYYGLDIDAGYVILEEGEVVEQTVNLNDY